MRDIAQKGLNAIDLIIQQYKKGEISPELALVKIGRVYKEIAQEL